MENMTNLLNIGTSNMVMDYQIQHPYFEVIGMDSDIWDVDSSFDGDDDADDDIYYDGIHYDGGIHSDDSDSS